jgi:hypothetical protein
MPAVSQGIILILHTCSLLSLKYAENHPRRSNVLLVYRSLSSISKEPRAEFKLIFQVVRKRTMVSVRYELPGRWISDVEGTVFIVAGSTRPLISTPKTFGWKYLRKCAIGS